MFLNTKKATILTFKCSIGGALSGPIDLPANTNIMMSSAEYGFMQCGPGGDLLGGVTGMGQQLSGFVTFARI